MNNDFESNNPRIQELNNRMKSLVNDINNILATLLYTIEDLKNSGREELQPSDLELLYNLQRLYLNKYKEIEEVIEELKTLIVNDNTNPKAIDESTELLNIYRRYLNLGNDKDKFTEN